MRACLFLLLLLLQHVLPPPLRQACGWHMSARGVCAQYCCECPQLLGSAMDALQCVHACMDDAHAHTRGAALPIWDAMTCNAHGQLYVTVHHGIASMGHGASLTHAKYRHIMRSQNFGQCWIVQACLCRIGFSPGSQHALSSSFPCANPPSDFQPL